jgi:hypothetical protein
VQASYASGSGSSALVFNYTVLAGQTDANGISVAANSLALNGGTMVDVAGNAATLTHTVVADNSGYLVDTAAPTVGVLAQSSSSSSFSNGYGMFDITFSESVTGFEAADISVTGGTVSLVSGEGASYTAMVYPTASSSTSISPVAFSVNVPAGAATDAAGNASTAATALTASILVGTTGNDSFAVSSAENDLFLNAGGDDTIKLSAANGSTVALPDLVSGFGSGDKIDLSAILGLAGYTSWSQSTGTTGSASSPIVFKNAAIVDDVNVNGDDTLFVDHVAQVEIWSNTTSTLFPSTLGLKFDFSTNTSITDFWLEANSGIAVPLYSDDYNSAGIGGMTGTANFTANKLLATAYFALNSNATGLNISLDALEVYNNTTKVFEVKTVPLTVTAGNISQSLALTVVSDTETLGTVSDNQLHMVSTYDATTDLTRLLVQYDTNSAYGTAQTTASDIIAMDFAGDLTSVLTPASLTFI